VGRRPGEKLFEELHAAGERQLPTSHPKIIVAGHRPADLAAVRTAIANLERLALEAPEKIAAQLQSLIPEFGEPAHSGRLARRAAA
jgi:FlaA1/EpsC-like NDP-sugar epimerase